MKALWDEGSSNVRDVHGRLMTRRKRAYTTVQTYMERLAEKGILVKEKQDAMNIYTPAITREEAMKAETGNLVETAFDGSWSKLAAFLFDSNALNQEGLDTIRALIQKREKSDE